MICFQLRNSVASATIHLKRAPVLVIVVLTMLLLRFTTFHSTPGPPISLRFVATTNANGRGRIIIFAITNSTGRKISFFPAEPHLKNGHFWPNVVHLRPPPSTPQLLGRSLASVGRAVRRAPMTYSPLIKSKGAPYR